MLSKSFPVQRFRAIALAGNSAASVLTVPGRTPDVPSVPSGDSDVRTIEPYAPAFWLSRGLKTSSRRHESGVEQANVAAVMKVYFAAGTQMASATEKSTPATS